MQFFHDLQFNIDAVRPPDLEVNWDDVPAPFKLYRNLPTISLPCVPNPVGDAVGRGEPTLGEISRLLRHTYGLTQSAHTYAQSDELETSDVQTFEVLRRYVPSGGALYPCELYVYLKVAQVEQGLYHYDAAHHRLDCLRVGNFDSFIEAAIGESVKIASTYAVVFVSTLYYKNFFKYHNFSYRLHGLDTGVVLGQFLEYVKHTGHSAAVCYQFLDDALNHLLGIHEQDETLYAVLPLSTRPLVLTDVDLRPLTASSELIEQINPISAVYHQSSKGTGDALDLVAANRQMKFDSTRLFRIWPRTGVSFNVSLPRHSLPKVEPFHFPFSQACRHRSSVGGDFVFGSITECDLSTLLKHSVEALQYTSDIAPKESPPPISLALCAFNVSSLAPGAYGYDASTHSLVMMRPGDCRMELAEGLSMMTVNLFQTAICLHLVGDFKAYLQELGPRGYRILQMETGILLQRMLLTASALGFSGHPLLGFDAYQADDLYGFDHETRTCLIEVPVGRYRIGSRWLAPL